MATQRLILTDVPADLWTVLGLDADKAYMLQNIRSSRDAFLADTDDAVAPDVLLGVAHVLRPYVFQSFTRAADPGRTWVWAGSSGATLIVSEAE